MNKKGFTLIELLAIIVILAIIAVITIPKITKITEKSRKDSASLSANGYIEAVEKFAMIKSQNDEDFDMEGEFTIIDGVLSKDTDSYNINVNGTIPSNGFLTISEGDVISGCITISKYKVIIENEKVSNTTKGNCLETYTITFDSNGGSEVASINTLSGRPITKPANPTKENTTFMGWYTEQELTNKFDFNTNITEDITLYAKWGTPVMNDDSWAEIKENLRENKNYYPLGSTKTVTMNLDGTNRNYTIRLSNTQRPTVCDNKDSNDNLTYSQSACGVVMEFITAVGNTYMNSTNTNYGGWSSSYMRTYLNTAENNIYSKLPDDLKEIIITTEPIVSGSGTSGYSPNTTGDKLYLLSGREAGFDASTDDNKRNVLTDTRTLDIYENATTEKYIKYDQTTGNQAVSWWLRNASSYGSGLGFPIVNNSSYGWNYYNPTNYYVVPAFRILEN